MKKIIIISLIIILSIIGIILGTNKTFFKSYYEITNSKNEKVKIPLPLYSYFERESGSFSVIFKTLRNVNKVQNILNKYVEYLPSCYDESYFYDKDLDITISRYNIEKGSPFNKIYLNYTYGNYCENEFVLANDWMDNVINSAVVKEADINKCIIENNGNTKCDSKAIKPDDINKFIRTYNQDSIVRIESKKNIDLDESKNYYSITVYYLINGKGYNLTIFNYNNYLAFDVVDGNDHHKNAIYAIDNNVNQLLKSIYDVY